MKLGLLQICLVLYLSFLVTESHSECGKPNDESDRIVHGRDVGYMKYPWFATLLLRTSRDRLMCGASLVGPRHIVTAAHCFKPFLKSADSGRLVLEELYHVKLGVNNICKEEESQQIFSTQKVYIHEKYREFMPYYDIALLELDRDANFTPICLPKTKYDDSTRPTDGIIVGLGKESSTAFRLPCTVKEARVLVYNDSICRGMLEGMKEDSSLLVDAFCAGYLEGGIDTCQGDSGGPLQTVDASTGLYELDGVTSFGFGCAAKGVLGVYTDISHYLGWIQDKIRPEVSFSITDFIKQQLAKYANNSYSIGENQLGEIPGVQVSPQEPALPQETPADIDTSSTQTTVQHISHPHKRRRYHRRHKNPLSALLNL